MPSTTLHASIRKWVNSIKQLSCWKRYCHTSMHRQRGARGCSMILTLTRFAMIHAFKCCLKRWRYAEHPSTDRGECDVLQVPVLAHRDIPPRCGIRSLSAHSGHRSKRLDQVRFMSTRRGKAVPPFALGRGRGSPQHRSPRRDRRCHPGCQLSQSGLHADVRQGALTHGKRLFSVIDLRLVLTGTHAAAGSISCRLVMEASLGSTPSQSLLS
jgi:hypothetical protein